jgi:hypothetical protein
MYLVCRSNGLWDTGDNTPSEAGRLMHRNLTMGYKYLVCIGWDPAGFPGVSKSTSPISEGTIAPMVMMADVLDGWRGPSW